MMLNRPTFTNSQWAVALVSALLLHVLLAWSLFKLSPVTQKTLVGQGAGLAVQSFSLSGANLPMLSDVAAGSPELVMVTSETPVKAVSSPVAPPQVRPMNEVAPVERKLPRDIKPTPKSRPKQQRARKDRKLLSDQKISAEDIGTKSAKAARAEAGEGRKGGPDQEGAAGADRAATPAPGNIRPRYPRLARKRGQEGRVVIRVSVLGNGRVGSAAVASSSGHSALDRAALKAVKRWRFEPALRAGKPVTATLTVPVVFRLEG